MIDCQLVALKHFSSSQRRYVQGCVFVGLWIIAHECGHRAFSESQTLNNFVGHVLHSFLLVPFHSWRITHGHHHANTNCVEDDAVYIPFNYKTKDAVEAAAKKHVPVNQHGLGEAF